MTAMGTVEVKIGGKVYPCRMTMGAMLRYRRLTGKEVSEMQGGSVSELATLLYCGTASACSADGVEFGMSLDEFCDLIGPEDMERMSAGIRADESGDGGSKKAEGIAELLGVAMGAMGMGLADFCSMTPEEFRQAHRAWLETEESRKLGDDEDAVGLRPPALEQEEAEAVGRAEVPLGLGGAD